jgi:hypothetical protein
MVQPIQYAVAPAYAQLAELSRGPAEGQRRRYWQDTVANVVESIAGLTAVDGATVMTTGYEVLAFGAKIARRKGSPQVEQVTMTEPIKGGRGVALRIRAAGRHAASLGRFSSCTISATALGSSIAGRTPSRVRMVRVRRDGPRASRRGACCCRTPAEAR